MTAQYSYESEVDRREAAIDEHLRLLRRTAFVTLRPASILVVSLLMLLPLGWLLYATFFWFANRGWQNEMIAIQVRFMNAMVIQMLGLVSIAMVTFGVTWAATELVTAGIRHLVYKVIATPEESEATLEFGTRDLGRSGKYFKWIALIGVPLCAVFMVWYGIRSAEALVRATTIALCFFCIAIVAVSHYETLRKARYFEGGLDYGLELAFGFLPTLSSGLQVFWTGVLLGVVVPHVLIPVGATLASNGNSIPRSLLEGAHASSARAAVFKEQWLQCFDRRYKAVLFKGLTRSDSVTVRVGPAQASAQLYVLGKGASVQVVARRGAWLAIQNGGWIAERHVKLEGFKDVGAEELYAMLMPPVAVVFFATALALIVAPPLIRSTQGLPWALGVSIVGTVLGNLGIAYVEHRWGRQDPNAVAMVLLASILSMIAGLVLTRPRRAEIT